VKLIVGLGNPGSRYEATRHNLGFLIIDRIAARQRIKLRTELQDALVGTGFIDREEIVLAKPQAYMNRSGPAVASLLQRFGMAADDLIVINDDLDLPFGRIRIRPGGSAGGHRGLASIAESLAGASFCRVRVGIGRPPEGADAAEFVLESFSAEELGQLSEIVERGADSVLCLVRHGVAIAMANYNRVS
jgi:PTH1 family peptidyl-tRNA hydrolase